MANGVSNTGQRIRQVTGQLVTSTGGLYNGTRVIPVADYNFTTGEPVDATSGTANGFTTDGRCTEPVAFTEGSGRYYEKYAWGSGGLAGGDGLPTLMTGEFLTYGDSQAEFGTQAAISTTTGYRATIGSFGLSTWLQHKSGYRLKPGLFSNFGMQGCTAAQAGATPRLNASGVTSTGKWWRGQDVPGPGRRHRAQRVRGGKLPRHHGLVRSRRHHPAQPGRGRGEPA